MPSGGARARSGPPPDRLALRRERDGKDWLHLPAAGRPGDAPAWPLPRPTKAELAIWVQEWRRPQAVEWERSGRVVEVALYVRNVVRAGGRNAPTSIGTLVMRQMTELGLTVMGLRANRWVIDDDDERARPARVPRPPRRSARERFEVIDGEGA